jgi:hypothetical protein
VGHLQGSNENPNPQQDVIQRRPCNFSTSPYRDEQAVAQGKCHRHENPQAGAQHDQVLEPRTQSFGFIPNQHFTQTSSRRIVGWEQELSHEREYFGAYRPCGGSSPNVRETMMIWLAVMICAPRFIIKTSFP